MISSTQAESQLNSLLDEVSQPHEPIHITGERSVGVLVSKEDWAAIQETLYLLSIPGMRKSMKKQFFLCVLVFVFVLGVTQAALEGASPDNPPMETLPFASEHMDEEKNDDWEAKVKAFHEDNLKRAPGGVVFIGDSITAGFPLAEMLPEQNPANRGIGGDAIWGLLRRLNESAYELKPSKVFVMIGVNDVFNNNMTTPQFRALYDYLFRELRKNCPGAKIYIQSVLPVRGNIANIECAKLNATIQALNQELKAVAKEQGLTFIDLFPSFLNEKGEMSEKFSSDGCHPIQAGHELWVKLLADAGVWDEK